jgi:hypothetical protein
MKQIQPVPMWINGKIVNADFITLYSVNDNLQTSATFYYQLSSADNQNLASGNLTMSGEDYIAWGNAQDINLAAFQWAASQLNITLL